MSGRLRLRATTLARLAELRALQRSKTELRVAQSDARLSDANAARAESAQSLAADEKAWAACVSARASDLILAAAWAGAVMKGAEKHDRLARDAASAEQTLERARSDCRQAIARAEATRKIARSADKKLKKRREEARMQESEDREARRKRRP